MSTVGWFNIKDYGAVGDGMAFDGHAVQTALSAAGVSGGIVYVPPGRYFLETTPFLFSNVVLRGDGVGASILIPSNSGGPQGVDLQNVSLQDISIVASTGGSAVGVSLSKNTNPNVPGVYLKNVEVAGFGGNGIQVNNAVGAVFEAVRSHGNGSYGLNVNGSTGSTLVGCLADSNTTGGFQLSTAINTSMLGCAVNGTPFSPPVVPVANVNYRLNPNGVQNTVLGTGAPKQLSFGDLATAGVSDFVTHNSVTLPDGDYLVTFDCAWPYAAAGIRGVYIKQNGNVVAQDAQSPNNVTPRQTLTALVQGGGSLTFNAYQNSGGTFNFVGSFVNVQSV